MYTMPARVKSKFNIDVLPILKNRTARIIWSVIPIGHIRDQYFTGQVDRLSGKINSENAKTFR